MPQLIRAALWRKLSLTVTYDTTWLDYVVADVVVLV